MSAKAIHEATAKRLLNSSVDSNQFIQSRVAVVTENTDWQSLTLQHPWLQTEVCVV